MNDPVAARVSPALWSKHLHPERRIPEHVRVISRTIRDEVVKGMQTDLGAIILVSLPPGHIKSDTCSIHTPEWFLENWPDRNAAVASYGQRKAAEWGRAIRNDVRDHPELFTIKLAQDSKAVDQFHTDAGGGLLATGVGGAFTGFRAHLLVVDDPVKDDEEARSELMREKTWEWFRTVAFTRCWPSAVKLVVMTRWHEDDLIGRIKTMYAEDSEVARYPLIELRYPAEAEEGDPLGRDRGEPLWPEGGYGRAWLDATKALVGSHNWAKMYQQRPAPEGGGMFRQDLFRYWSRDAGGNYVLHHEGGTTEIVTSTDCWVGQTVDTAMKDKTIHDWTVILTFAVTPKRRILILDVTRRRIEIPDQLPLIKMMRSRFNPRWTAVEEKASGIGLIQEARRQGIFLKPIAANTDKVTRATPASVLYEQRQIFHPQHATWVADFEHELLVFPNGQHDDQVDTIAHAINEVGGVINAANLPRPRERTEVGMHEMMPGGKPW